MSDLTVMSDFAARVKEKVKRDFAGMIPDDAWDKLVKESVESFIKNDLDALVKKELAAEVSGRLAKYFQTEEWQGQWDYKGNGGQGSETASKKVKELIAENMPVVIEALLGNAIQAIVNDLRYKISQRMM